MKSLPLTLTSTTLKPARLAQITRRDGTILRIAEAQSTISTTNTSPSTTWSPIQGVTLSAVRHVVGGEPQSLEIVVVHSDGGDFDTADINNGLYDGASVIVYVVDRDNPSILGELFRGTIEPIVYNTTGQAIFDCRGQSVKSPAFVQTFAPMCRTDLFSTLCTLNENDWDFTATVATIVDRFNITLSGVTPSSPADNWLNDGVVINTTTGFRFITALWTQSGNQLRTYWPICQTHLTVGDALTLYPGCDKRIVTCKDKFNNPANFQGEPHFLGAAAVGA